MPEKKSEKINKTVMIIQELSEDEKIEYETDMRERAEINYNLALYSAFRHGYREGIEKRLLESGETDQKKIKLEANRIEKATIDYKFKQYLQRKEERKAKMEMAKVLLQNGTDINLIVASSGFSQEEIEQFCK